MSLITSAKMPRRAKTGTLPHGRPRPRGLRPYLRGIAIGLSTALGVGLACSPLSFSAESRPAASLVIPNYWDQQRRIDKPNLSGISGNVRFLTAPDHPPFNFVNEKGELTGFNIELLTAACLELELRCSIQALAFDQLLPALRKKQAEGVAAGLTLNARLRQEMEVGDVYLHNPARFAVRRDAGQFSIDENGLGGRKIGVIANSAHAAFLAAFFSKAVMTPFPDAAAAREALKRGEIDALFADAIGMSFWINGSLSENCCLFRGGAFDESYYFGEGYALVFRPGADTLRRAFDHALLRLAERGVYAELYLRWFPVGIY